jgi:hypothetical protein
LERSTVVIAPYTIVLYLLRVQQKGSESTEEIYNQVINLIEQGIDTMDQS